MIVTLRYIISKIQEASPEALLQDGFGHDQPVSTWEQQVRDVMSDQRCKCHPDFRPEEDIFGVRAWLKDNEIFSGETGEKIYTVINASPMTIVIGE